MQTSYAINTAAAVPGVIADAQFGKNVNSMLAESNIGFGLAVVQGAADNTAKVPSASGQRFIGVSVKTDAYSQLNSGSVGYRATQAANVADKGKYWVLSSGAVNKGDPVFYNVTTGQFGPQAVPALTAVYTKNAGATGNYTASAVTAVPPAQAGTYVGTFTDATHYDVVDGSGNFIASGTTGVAFGAGGLGFTITAGGTAAVEGDGFHIAVTAAAATTDQAGQSVWDTTIAAAGIAVININKP